MIMVLHFCDDSVWVFVINLIDDFVGKCFEDVFVLTVVENIGTIYCKFNNVWKFCMYTG